MSFMSSDNHQHTNPDMMCALCSRVRAIMENVGTFQGIAEAEDCIDMQIAECTAIHSEADAEVAVLLMLQDLTIALLRSRQRQKRWL